MFDGMCQDASLRVEREDEEAGEFFFFVVGVGVFGGGIVGG